MFRKLADLTTVVLFVMASAALAEPPEITTSLPDFRMYSVGDTLLVTLAAKGGTAPYRWLLESTTAPAGVTLAEFASGGVTEYRLTGKLTEAGVWLLGVTVTDATGASTKGTLRLAVSRMRLVNRSVISLTVSQPFRVALRVEGGTHPYRIEPRPDSKFIFGVQYDPETAEFYGTPAMATNQEIWMEIHDASGDLLRTTVRFEFQSPNPGWAFNVRMQSSACGRLTVQADTNPSGRASDVTVEWGDGGTEKGLRTPLNLGHTYRRDGWYDLRILVREASSGGVVTGTYTIDVRHTDHDLCTLSLRLQPHALYMVRGKTIGRVRLDSRTATGEYHPVAGNRFTWSATPQSPVRVDNQGLVTCAGIGEGRVELVSREIPWRIGAPVFCGEYGLEPAITHLSPMPGNNQAQLSAVAIASDGRRSPAPFNSLSLWTFPQESANLVTLTSDGRVNVNRGPRGKSENLNVGANVGGVNSRNWAVVRVTGSDLGMPTKPWLGENVTLWFPDQVGTFDYKEIVERTDASRVADLIYRLEEEESGLRPYKGGMQHLAAYIGFENDPQTPCGGSGNPAAFGTRIDRQFANSCFMDAGTTTESSVPHFNVWAHEIGHGFHGESVKFDTFMRAGSLSVAAESVASHHGCYALWYLMERRLEYKSPVEFFGHWLNGCAFDRKFDDLKRYQATGPDIRKIDVEGVFDIMMILRVEYGWEAQRRFFSVFLPAYEDFPFTMNTLEHQATFFAAAYSAATRTDLRERFKKEYGFPIDEQWYAANYDAIDTLVSQRDPAVTAGADQATQPGVPIALSQAAAFDPLDRAMTFQWRVVQQPAGSRALLSDPKILNPQFTPDVAGVYRLELVAADGLFTSKPATVVITAAGSASGCTYAVSVAGLAFRAAGGNGYFEVNSPTGCVWSVSGSPAWIKVASSFSGAGKGRVDIQVEPNTGTARAAVLSVEGIAFRVEQSGGAGSGFTDTGTIAHVASGSEWKTTITMVNTGDTAAPARLSFYSDTGTPLMLPLSVLQTGQAGPILGSELERTLAPGATLVIESEGVAGSAVQTGWAQLSASGAVTAVTVFRQKVGTGEQEAVVLMETRKASSYVLVFDNTQGFVSAVALVNPSATSMTVAVTLRDETGNLILNGEVPLAVRGHAAFALADRFAVAGNKRGTVEFSAPEPRPIGVLGLRFNPKGAFTTIPAIAK